MIFKFKTGKNKLSEKSLFKMNIINLQCYSNSLARIESNWTFRDGDNSLITSISCTKQSNLLSHFLGHENCLSRSLGTIQCLSQ